MAGRKLLKSLCKAVHPTLEMVSTANKFNVGYGVQSGGCQKRGGAGVGGEPLEKGPYVFGTKGAVDPRRYGSQSIDVKQIEPLQVSKILQVAERVEKKRT